MSLCNKTEHQTNNGQKGKKMENIERKYRENYAVCLHYVFKVLLVAFWFDRFSFSRVRTVNGD